MIEENDKIAVGLSGGKDSVTLLHILKNYQKFSPVKFELIAITLNPGGVDNGPLHELCKNLEVPFYEVQCLLYEDTPECKYTAIRISSKRLQDFCMGKKDLRSLFLSPEGDKAYFNVRGADNNLVLDLKINTTIPEDRLPDEGYYLETSGKESIVVNIPVKDKGLFTEIVRKFGWACM